jgi:hypothetical protein
MAQIQGRPFASGFLGIHNPGDSAAFYGYVSLSRLIKVNNDRNLTTYFCRCSNLLSCELPDRGRCIIFKRQVSDTSGVVLYPIE